MRCKDSQVRGPRIRSLLSNVVGRRHVRNFASVVITAREREGITSSSTSIYAKRVFLCPDNDFGGVCDVIVVFFGPHDCDGRVKIGGGVVEVGASFIGRGAMDPLTGFSFANNYVYLSFLIRHRGRDDNSVLPSSSNVFGRGFLSLFREGEVSS